MRRRWVQTFFFFCFTLRFSPLLIAASSFLCLASSFSFLIVFIILLTYLLTCGNWLDRWTAETRGSYCKICTHTHSRRRCNLIRFVRAASTIDFNFYYSFFIKRLNAPDVAVATRNTWYDKLYNKLHPTEQENCWSRKRRRASSIVSSCTWALIDNYWSAARP